MTIGTPFNDGWAVRGRLGPFEGLGGGAPPYVAVTLPHDAMLTAGRDPGGDPHVAYFRPGAYEYSRSFQAPPEWCDKRVSLRFEGIYRDATVFVNGEVAAQLAFGYGELLVRLDDFLRYGDDNIVHVECRSGGDSRWYSGAGIYRDVTLFVAEPVHVAVDGIRVTTPEPDVVVAEVSVDNATPRRRTEELIVEILDGDAVVAADRQRLTVPGGGRARARARVVLVAPRPWSLEEPHLYTCRTRIGDDLTSTTFGVRTISVDPRRGLRLNGETLKLRGACIHHDGGVLGAATFHRAEQRRVEILKGAGFNAIRMAHHPASRPLLDACDRLGMLVMDEAWDVWRDAKRDQDYAMHIPAQWRNDLDGMVIKDRNRPSVVLYSVGNEMPEVGTTAGAMLAREMADHLRALDPDRPVTCGANLWLPLLSDGQILNEVMDPDADVDVDDLVSNVTEEFFAALDVAGYNYAEQRYEADVERYPNRVIVGSETWPRNIDTLWRRVLGNDHLIGDFTWTGWDYLGEVGLGRLEYESDPEVETHGERAAYPWRYANCGDIDITGYRLPISYYREIVFGLRTDPYLAVRPPEHHQVAIRKDTPWSWSSAISSWTWPVEGARPVTVEVYADADEVELIQDGAIVGRATVDRYRSEFDVAYAPGELVAVAYRNGREIGRSMLRSARDDVHVSVTVDGDPTGDVVFVPIELRDDAGTLHTATDRLVTVTVEGPGRLQGIGNAAPASEESFLDDRCTTFRGRALAVVRPTGSGAITVSVRADGLETASVSFKSRRDADPAPGSTSELLTSPGCG